MAAQTHEFLVDPAMAGGRLDRVVVTAAPDLTRTYVQTLIDRGLVSVNGGPAKAGHKLHAGDLVAVTVPPPESSDLLPEALPLTIVYEDETILVIDKPAGLVVHPAPGHPTGTLVNAVLAHAPTIAMNGTTRPGIVHRLDKDTSGLLVVAKTDAARQDLVSQFAGRSVLKEYLALVHGDVAPTVIDAPIGRDPRHRQRMAVTPNGRPARTDMGVEEALPGCTLVRTRIHTGRTHQIRVHLASLGHPVVGDDVYGRGDRLVRPMRGRQASSTIVVPRQFLHAARLGFRMPSTGEWHEFASPLPPELESVLAALRS